MAKQVDFPGRMVDQVEWNSTANRTPPERQPHFSNEGNKMIWFGDKFSISVVDLRDLSQTIIENGLKEVLAAQQVSDKIPEPLNCICDFEANKILVVYAIEEERILVYSSEHAEN